MHKPIAIDLAAWVFGLLALLCLIVSAPATLIGMQLFHGLVWGWFAMVVFECGAVASELMTLSIPQWRGRLLILTIVLLAATTGFNYALGVDEFIGTAVMPQTYRALRMGGYGWLLALIASALFPALLLVFLTAFTARVRMLRGGYDTPLKAVAFWVGVFGQQVRSRVSSLEQVLAERDTQVNSLEQVLAERSGYVTALEQARDRHAATMNTMQEALHRACCELEQARQHLNSRPPALEIEVVQVARYALTWEQLAQLTGVSVSTMRRRVPVLVGKESSCAGDE